MYASISTMRPPGQRMAGQAPRRWGCMAPDYLKRATIALVGLGLHNLLEDAVYRCWWRIAREGRSTALNRYLLHFDRKELHSGRGLLVSNHSTTRTDSRSPTHSIAFAIGDRDELKYNADGSLDLHIQFENRGWTRAELAPSPCAGERWE